MNGSQGKTALITGAARGIGRPSPRPMSARARRVAIGDIDIDRARATAAEIGRAIAVEMDVTGRTASTRPWPRPSSASGRSTS
jgi:galactitol 2-dehydrogenase